MGLNSILITRFPNGLSDQAENTIFNSVPFPTKEKADFYEYFNDFLTYTAADWTITNANGGTLALADEAGGVLRITNGATNGWSVSMQKVGEAFLPEVGKRFAARIRVRTSSQALAPEKLFRRDLLQVYRTPIALGGVALCMAFAILMAWIVAPTQLTEAVLVAVLSAAGALGIWAGAWALVSRLTVGAWQLRVHLALASICLALWAWGWWLYGLAMFALQWRRLTPVAIALAALVAFVIAWRHLRYATRMRRVFTLALALLAPLLGGGVWWLVDQQLDPRTVNRVVQGPAIQPPSVRVSPSLDLDDYLSDVAELKREANRNRQQSLLASPIHDEED